MKIIGKTEYGLIMTIYEDELAMLFGERRFGRTTLDIGAEFKVKKTFDRLKWLHRNSNSVSSIVEQLRKLADNLEPLDPVVSFLCGEGEK